MNGKIGAAVYISILLSISPPAFAERWHPLASEGGNSFDIELDSLVNFFVYKEAWIRLKLGVNQAMTNVGGEKITELKFHRRIDCLRKRMLTDSLVQSGPNGVRHVFDIPKDKQTWSPVDPTDVADKAVFSYVCQLFE